MISARRLAVPVLAATVAALVPAGAATAQTAPDITPPRLVSFGFSPATVDVTNGSAAVTAIVCATDENPIDTPAVTFDSDATTQLSGGTFSGRLTSGTVTNGCWTITNTISVGAAPGTWTPVIFPLRDSLQNSSGFITRPEKLNVVNGPTAPPVTPPVTPPAVPPVTPTPPRPVTPAPVPVAPRVTAQPRAVSLGQSSLVTVDGAAGAAVELLAYTRPGTTYRVVRRGTLSRSGDFGRIAWNVAPAGNTRLYARVGGRNSPTTTINVASTSTIGVTNAGGTYRFTGAVRPAAGGQTVTLLRALPGGGAALVGRAATSPSGVWRIDRRFSGSGTFAFYAVTSGTADNVSGRSRNYVVAVSPPPAPKPVVRPAAPAPSRPSQPSVPPRPADRDCPDFATQAQAQAFHDYYYPYYGDFARLDQGGIPGVACEDLP